MRFLLLLLIATCSHAAIAPYAVQSNQVDATVSNVVTSYINPPGGHFWLYFNSATNQMETLALGTNLSITGGVLNDSGGSGSTPSASSATRSFNTAYQVSTLRGCRVNYSVRITVTATILSGQEGEIILEQADDSAFTSNVVTLSTVGNSQTFSLAVAIQGVQALTFQIGADYVPASKWLRPRTNSVTGSPTYTYRSGREVLE